MRTLLSALLFVGLLAGVAVAGGFEETEPNDTKDFANLVDPPLDLGDDIVGKIDPGGDVDYFLVQTAPLGGGLWRQRLVITPTTPERTGCIRGLGQFNGDIFPNSNVVVQESSNATTPPQFNQWYSFGGGDRFYYSVTGDQSSATVQYHATLQAEPITPHVIHTKFVEGMIKIETFVPPDPDTDLWVYNGLGEAMGGYGNDDELYNPSGESELIRPYDPGTYYLALTDSNFANDLPSPDDDNYRNGKVLEFGGMAVNSSLQRPLNLDFAISDQYGHSAVVGAMKTGPYDIQWFEFTVVPEPCSVVLLILGACPFLLRRRR